MVSFVFVLIIIHFQIHDEAKKFSYQTGVKVVVAYGGAPINQQVVIASNYVVHIILALYYLIYLVPINCVSC